MRGDDITTPSNTESAKKGFIGSEEGKDGGGGG